ncbi:kinetoplastid kinetochore protein 9 [Trypanosoma equiperdum]|uniref:RAB6-interacting golgin n=1 Tax=Trypanosoma equiperdum TaxID=5694 RepID=A0A1G4IAL5_TRYEQ|nr:kinetoplastid kinetochore protein 9 [Trypanosoma equiperdum]
MSSVLTRSFSSCAGKLEETRELIKRDLETARKHRIELRKTIDDDLKRVEKERAELLGIVEEQEAKINRSVREFEEVRSRREWLKKEHDEAVKRYVKMSDTVTFIKEGDKRLQDRTDFEAVLEEENTTWADRERQLIASVSTHNTTLKQARRERRKEVETLETELAEMTKKLEQERIARREDLQQESQGLLRSRRGTPQPPSQRPTVAAVHTQAFEPLEANRKEQQFIAINKSSCLPTRQIRSCFKNNNSTGGNRFSNELETGRNTVANRRRSTNGSGSTGQGVSQHFHSAPVSRATSQSLVSGDSENIVKIRGAASQRAFSYADTKRVAGRKHELLRDSTNI